MMTFCGLLPVLLVCLLGMTSAKVKLASTGGYESVTVAINPDIKENYHMLWRLEEFLTMTSATLFRATKKQVYFKEFLIVIPEEWKPRQHYENAMDVDLDRAQIIIDRSNPAYGDAPYVKQYAECGSPGLYIHLTPGYLLDDAVVQKWGKPDKTLVHEWAHLRWGLFDEYPIDAQDDAFYRYRGLWQPTRCSHEVEGSILNEYTSKPCSFNFFTGKPEKNCRFFPRMTSNKAAASLMFMQYLDSIVEFCDSPRHAPKHLRHNYLAPNRHNRLCNYKSSWEVMRKHSDFKYGRTPLPDSTDTAPLFRYVQAHPRKRVMVLDTSGSMTGASMNVMKQAASNYILSCIESGSKMGIVQFSTNASALSYLKEVSSESDRFKLIDSLPTKSDGKTSIGAGLAKGVEVLTSDGEAPGGTIILITDGKENEGPYLKDLRPALMKKGIVVHALAYGQKADTNIASLSEETGGKTFFYSGKPNSTALIDGLAATVTSDNSAIPKSNVPLSILTDAGRVRPNIPMTGTFYIDSTIGRETSLTFGYTKFIEVTVEGPEVIYTAEQHPECFYHDKPSKVLKIILPGISVPGLWRYRVTTNSTNTRATVSVQSKAKKKGDKVIQVRSWIPDMPQGMKYNPQQKLGVYAEVLKGKAPVLGATVLASVERPMGKSIDLQLFDNGVGADIIKDDGVYASSVLASDLNSNGRYNIKVKVFGHEGKVNVVVGGAGRSSGALEKQSAGQMMNTQTAALEEFQRVTSAGEFRLEGFVPVMSFGGKAAIDQMPPSRITDLHVVNFDYERFTARLRWTAVGDDLERGTAHHYAIRSSNDFEKHLFNLSTTTLLTSNDVLSGNLSQPTQPGSTEEIQVKVHGISKNKTVFFSVAAVDEAGNEGDTSNLVSLSPAQETAVPRTAKATLTAQTTLTHKTYLALALPVALAVFVALVLAVMVVVVRAKRVGSVKVDSKSLRTSASVSSVSDLDFSNMNYMYEGEYRKRQPENLGTWNEEKDVY